VAQNVGLEFKPQYHKKEEEKEEECGKVKRKVGWKFENKTG
jgi:hypothetical protein